MLSVWIFTAEALRCNHGKLDGKIDQIRIKRKILKMFLCSHGKCRGDTPL